MARAADYDARSTNAPSDLVYVFTDSDDYKTTWASLFTDLGVVQLVDGTIPLEQLPPIVVQGADGDVKGPAGAADGEIAVYNGTTGRLLKALSALRLLPASGGANGKFLGFAGDVPAWSVSPIPPGGTNGQVLSTNGSGTLTWVDRDPAVGTEGQVLTNVGGAWVATTPTVPDVDSASMAAAIEAESNVITNMTPTTYMLVIQDDGDGGWTVGKVDIGGGAAAFDPSAVVTTNASGALQTTDYADMPDALDLGDGSDVMFGSVSIGSADTTITRTGAGAVAVEGSGVVLANSSPTLGTLTVTAIELSHATQNTLSASGGVLSVEGHAAVTKDQSVALSAGFSQTEYAAGTKTTGTFTPDVANGAMQTATNGGAHTLAPPSANCSMAVLYTNNGSAGTITTSGFTKVDGDSFTTTNTHKFICSIMKSSVGSWLTVKAMQ